MKKCLCIVVLLALGVAALWWFTRPTVETPPPAKVAEAPVGLKSPLVVSTPKPAQLEAPKAAPVPASTLVAASGATTSSTSANLELSADDPHASPQTLIPELINLLEDDDFVGYLKASMPPSALNMEMQETKVSSIEELAEKYFPASGSLAKLTAIYKQGTLQALHAIQGLTPVLDSSNVNMQAVYTINQPINGKNTITFIKIGGLWYQTGN